MTTKQRIINAISLLNEEKNLVSTNMYMSVTDALTNVIPCLYVLKWISLVPIIQTFDNGDYITYIQKPCSSLIPLTMNQSDMITNCIQVGSNAAELFWQDICISSVPCFGAHRLRFNGKDVVINEWSVLLSLDEFTKRS
jgi:hypothetical protein